MLTETSYAPPEPKENPLGKNQWAALETFERLYDEFRLNFENEGKSPDDAKVSFNYWREQSGLPLNRFGEVRDGLLDAGSITLRN